MKISPINNLSFQKRLLAKSEVLSENKPMPCNIFLLDPAEDFHYFNKMLMGGEWDDAFLVLSTADDFHYYNDKFYVMEDENENCLAYAAVSESLGKNGEIVSAINKFETVPKYTSLYKTRKVKHIGKTMIDFLQKLKCEKQRKILSVPLPSYMAVGFYKKQGFDWNNDYGLVMTKPNFDEQARIDFVG